MLMVGVLEFLWSAHENRWADRSVGQGRYASEDDMRAVEKVHGQILYAIRRGDADTASDLTRQHVRKTQRLVLSGLTNHTVEASALGPAWSRS